MGDVLHFIMGPIIGCIIGAFTNFIAIKMLFRPLKPVYIGKFRVPFTPGVIPKHQAQLADSLSNVVYNNFFTNADIEGIFLSDDLVESFTDGIYGTLTKSEAKGRIREIVGDEKAEEISINAKAFGYNLIHQGIMRADIAGMVATETEKVIKSKIKGSVSGLILNEAISLGIPGYVGKEVEKYIKENDLEILLPVLEEEGKELKKLNLVATAEEIGIDRELTRNLIREGYKDFMNRSKTRIAENFHIKQFIHDKIMELDTGEIERLVNQAIKREMNYLVYLGGLLGLIIGLVNSFI